MTRVSAETAEGSLAAVQRIGPPSGPTASCSSSGSAALPPRRHLRRRMLERAASGVLTELHVGVAWSGETGRDQAVLRFLCWVQGVNTARVVNAPRGDGALGRAGICREQEGHT
jgi:hypothetical protein